MGGIAHWPDPGGLNDQAAWVFEAFGLLAGLEAAFDRTEKALGGAA